MAETAPTDEELARMTAHSRDDWQHARERLGPEFPRLYQHCARLAALAGHNKVGRAADEIGDIAGIRRPQGWLLR